MPFTGFIWDVIPENPGRRVRKRDREEKVAKWRCVLKPVIPVGTWSSVLLGALGGCENVQEVRELGHVPNCSCLSLVEDWGDHISLALVKFMGRAGTSGHREISQAKRCRCWHLELQREWSQMVKGRVMRWTTKSIASVGGYQVQRQSLSGAGKGGYGETPGHLRLVCNVFIFNKDDVLFY